MNKSMPYLKPLLVDQYASDIEERLTRTSLIPFIGTISAVCKIAFGAIQTLCATTTLAASIFWLYRNSRGMLIFVKTRQSIQAGSQKPSLAFEGLQKMSIPREFR